MRFDYCVVGGGIVGLATALKLLDHQPGAGVLLLEKERDLGIHQTGHNSGVIHSGIYYAPGSLKAELCKRGAEATKGFCRENGIPFETCGKLIVATTSQELQRLGNIQERAAANGINVERIEPSELRRIEPNVDGLGALLAPSTGIVDYREVCRAMARRIEALGGHVVLGAGVTAMVETSKQVEVVAGDRYYTASRLVACAGLQSDRLARLVGIKTDLRIIPFRGEYYRLPETRNDIVRHLIYPVPDPALPFLGIHLTKMIGGYVTVGPNAVLGFAREDYGSRWAVAPRDLASVAAFPGFWRMLRKNIRPGLLELRNAIWKRGYLKECQRYCPSLTLADLRPHPAGIRAQAVRTDGTLVQDFAFAETDRTLHVLNAPSPAATSAIPIGDTIAAKLTKLRRRIGVAI